MMTVVIIIMMIAVETFVQIVDPKQHFYIVIKTFILYGHTITKHSKLSFYDVSIIGKDCWNYCGRRDGSCGFCGLDGYCCRRGWNGNDECKRSNSPCEGFHCCTVITPLSEVKNVGKWYF